MTHIPTQPKLMTCMGRNNLQRHMMTRDQSGGDMQRRRMPRSDHYQLW
jgi:hypothetical protein